MKYLIFAALCVAVRAQVAEFTVPYSDFDGNTNLPGGDRIKIEEFEDACVPANKIAVEFKLGSLVRNWKGVKFHPHGDPSNDRTIAEREGSMIPITSWVWDDELNYNFLVFWNRDLVAVRNKAAYLVEGARLNMRAGYRYDITWVRDI